MDIASMLEVEVQEVVESKENVTPSHKTILNFPCPVFSDEENDFYKLTYGNDVASIRFLRLHCTACDDHIGSAPAEAYNMHEHPVLHTLLCAKCREFYGDGTFEQGDDATDMFCRWCANGGNLYCCSYCSNTFCSKCIKRNLDPEIMKRIEAEDTWKCFVCDAKDLFPLRAVTRALITHIETVTRILKNDTQMSSKEIEEKMHLDETKCCSHNSRKRKRRKRQALSTSDDEENDSNYVPCIEINDSPPNKKRQIQKECVPNIFNGYSDHKYYSSKKFISKTNVDSTDLMIPCEQTMIEGDTEIMNPNDSCDSLMNSMQNVKNHINSQNQQISIKKNQIDYEQELPQVQQEKQQVQHQQKQQNQQHQQVSKLSHQQRPHILRKIVSNKSMAINPVPLANLLKVAISTGAKRIKVTHAPNKKLVALPMTIIPKSVASSNITFVKPTHFILPKNSSNNSNQPPSHHEKLITTQSPSIIDLESDDEPVILENNNELRNNSNVCNNTNIVAGITNTQENLSEQIQIDNNNIKTNDKPVVLSPTNLLKTVTEVSRSKPINATANSTIDEVTALKTQQRSQRFNKMLLLQSQEINKTLLEMKTKIHKLLKISNTKSLQNQDLLHSAALSTKRFHRILRKALVELSNINDRVVRDFIHWKKKTDKIVVNRNQQNKSNELEDKEEMEMNQKNISRSQSTIKDDLTLEMVCVRDSGSESDNEENREDSFGNNLIEAMNIPGEFSQLFNNLTIFKRKPTSAKAVGDHSVLMEDKGCQAYDVPWRDYEKCIGYSLLNRIDSSSDRQKETWQTTLCDEHFGKYQEQYLFYLQHIEDFGIETDELKGLSDSNHTSLKDIDGNSPFIMDMLDRLNPVTLSNGSSSNIKNTINDHQYYNTNISDENMGTTSKAVEELVKMVTKLSEDLLSEDDTERKDKDNIDLESESLSVVDSILNANGVNSNNI